jgi:hypothetical protein
MNNRTLMNTPKDQGIHLVSLGCHDSLHDLEYFNNLGPWTGQQSLVLPFVYDLYSISKIKIMSVGGKGRVGSVGVSGRQVN